MSVGASLLFSLLDWDTLRQQGRSLSLCLQVLEVHLPHRGYLTSVCCEVKEHSSSL